MKRLLILISVLAVASCRDKSKSENVFCNSAGKCIEAETFSLSDKDVNYSESVSSSSVIKDVKSDTQELKEFNTQIKEMQKEFDNSFKEMDKHFNKAFDDDFFEVGFPKITFPKIKVPFVKEIPFKNELVYIDITPKNAMETKILDNVREALKSNKNKIVEKKEKAKAILSGMISDKVEDFKDGKKYSLQVNLKINKGKNIVKNIKANLLETGKDLEELKARVLKNLNAKIYKKISVQ